MISQRKPIAWSTGAYQSTSPSRRLSHGRLPSISGCDEGRNTPRSLKIPHGSSLIFRSRQTTANQVQATRSELWAAGCSRTASRHWLRVKDLDTFRGPLAYCSLHAPSYAEPRNATPDGEPFILRCSIGVLQFARRSKVIFRAAVTAIRGWLNRYHLRRNRCRYTACIADQRDRKHAGSKASRYPSPYLKPQFQRMRLGASR